MNRSIDDFISSLLKNFKVSEDHTRYCIYFVECNSVFKIGTTSNLKARLRALQTSNPTPINLVYTISIPIKRDHREIEKALHTIFVEYSVRGEWYKINQDDIERIKLLSIDDILNIAEKMRTINESQKPTHIENPGKPKDQMAFDFYEDNNL